MRYAILTNPATGVYTVDEKRRRLMMPSKILNAPIYGLDTKTASDMKTISKKLAQLYDVIVVAGGDGTLSDVINSIDTTQTPIAYLPIGSGNAMKYALHYTGNLNDIAMQIKNGSIHEYDLISCDGKKRGYVMSIGIDGTALFLRNKYLSYGMKGFISYAIAVLTAFFKYRPTHTTLKIDGQPYEIKKLLSLQMMKQPYYGYGLPILPHAQFDDGQIHGQILPSHPMNLFNPFNLLIRLIKALTARHTIGQPIQAKEISVHTQDPLILQIDGNIEWMSNVFNFKILPKALKIKF